MSKILSSRHGNLSKVKYFLQNRGRAEEFNPNPKTLKKHSLNQNTHHQSITSNGDISFEVIAIHQNSQEEDDKENSNTFVRSKNHSLNPSNGQSKVVQAHKRSGPQKSHRSANNAASLSISTIQAIDSSRWHLPQSCDKQQFQKFISTLSQDQTYQHTVTMFTIMYFYQQKKGARK